MAPRKEKNKLSHCLFAPCRAHPLLAPRLILRLGVVAAHRTDEDAHHGTKGGAALATAVDHTARTAQSGGRQRHRKDGRRQRGDEEVGEHQGGGAGETSRARPNEDLVGEGPARGEHRGLQYGAAAAAAHKWGARQRTRRKAEHRFSED